jgi:magnesium transporter
MLINCAACQDGRKLADIPIEDISEYVARPECFVWVALKDPRPDELAVMKEEFGLHELAIEDALQGHQRPKIEEYGESLFAVMHTVELEKDNELHIGEVDVFGGANYVLSVRHRTRYGFTDVRARCEREPKLLKEGSAFVLYAPTISSTAISRCLKRSAPKSKKPKTGSSTGTVCRPRARSSKTSIR